MDFAVKKYRTLFISDVHLGTKVSQSQNLHRYLATVEVEKLYLLGDFADISNMRRHFFWDKHHNALIRHIFKMVKHGVEVVYIPGNHDKELRDFAGMDFAGIKIKLQDIHTTHDGRRFLLLHGDKFDGVLNEKLLFLYTFGDRCYDLALLLSKYLNCVLALFGRQWSLSKYLKSKVKNVLKFINDFETLVIREARTHGVDGVICGHIHTPVIRKLEGLLYANCGCWTESNSAVAELPDGTLELINLSPQEQFNTVKKNAEKDKKHQKACA